MIDRIYRTLSSFIPDRYKQIIKPEKGRFKSGRRDDYATDTSQRETTPQRLGDAMQKADQGDTHSQYEIFEECERDSIVGREYFKRRLSVVNKDLQILPASEDAKDVKAAELCNDVIFKIERLNQVLFNLTDAIGKAFSVGAIVWEQKDGLFVPVRVDHWPQQNFQLGDPAAVYSQDHDQIRVLTDEHPSKGKPIEDFTSGQWIVHVQKNWSQPIARAALFRSVVWRWLFKKFGIQDWAIFLERYGIPPRMAKYGPSAQKEDRDALIEALLNLGKDHACIYPDNSNIELLETKGLSSGAPHPNYIKFLNEEITIAINGNAMSTTQGDKGARSAKEAFQVDEGLQTAFDSQNLAQTVRDQLCAPVIENNLGSGYTLPKVAFPDERKEDLNERAKRDEIIHRMGYDITKPYIEKTYSIPQKKDGEEILERPTTAAVNTLSDMITLKAQKKNSLDWVISHMPWKEE